jgi:hypothetical protein
MLARCSRVSRQLCFPVSHAYLMIQQRVAAVFETAGFRVHFVHIDTTVVALRWAFAMAAKWQVASISHAQLDR